MGRYLLFCITYHSNCLSEGYIFVSSVLCTIPFRFHSCNPITCIGLLNVIIIGYTHDQNISPKVSSYPPPIRFVLKTLQNLLCRTVFHLHITLVNMIIYKKSFLDCFVHFYLDALPFSLISMILLVP